MANAVQNAVLANRSSLILREKTIEAEVTKALKPLLAAWERTIREAVTKRGKNLTPAQLADAIRRTSVLRDIQAVSQQYAAIVEKVVSRTIEGVYRGEVYRASAIASANPFDAKIAAGFGGVSRTAVLAASQSILPGRSVTTTFRTLGAGVVQQMRRDLSRAIADGWDLDTLSKKWASGVGAGRILNDARALARTAMMAASNEGQVFAWKSEGRYRQLRWNATFDARTCPYCGARHGKVYDIDNLPAIPAHIGCRCVWVPVFRAESEKLLKELSPYVRGGPGEQAGRTRSYEAWLKKQPKGVQLDALGSETKQRLWKSGDLSLEDLSRPDATTITDEEALRLSGSAPAPAPAAPAPASGQSLPEIKGRTNRELADSFSGPKGPDAYDGETIGEGIRAKMAREVRAVTKEFGAKSLAAIDSEMNAIAEKIDSMHAAMAGRSPTAEENAVIEKLGEDLDNLLGQRSIAEGGVPREMQAKFHQLVRLPGNRRGLKINTDVVADLAGVSPENMKTIEGRVRVVTDLISKRVADRPFYNDTTGYSPTRKTGTVKTLVVPGNYRANYDYVDRVMRLSEHNDYRVIAHELGHHVEASDSRVAAAAQKYLARRTAGEVSVELKSLRPNSGYRDGELTKPDKFLDPYWGKRYLQATEIVSMGLEYVIEEPWTLARKDPETFDFVMAILRGDYNEMDKIADGIAASVREKNLAARGLL